MSVGLQALLQSSTRPHRPAATVRELAASRLGACIFGDRNLFDELVRAFERDSFTLTLYEKDSARAEYRALRLTRHPCSRDSKGVLTGYRTGGQWHAGSFDACDSDSDGADSDGAGDEEAARQWVPVFVDKLPSLLPFWTLPGLRCRQATFRVLCSLAMIAASSKALKGMTATFVATYRQRLEMLLAKEITPFSPVEHFRLFGGTMGLCEAATQGDILKVRQCLAVGIDSEAPWSAPCLGDEDDSDCSPKPSFLQGIFSCCRPKRECPPGEGTPLECAHRYGR